MTCLKCGYDVGDDVYITPSGYVFCWDCVATIMGLEAEKLIGEKENEYDDL